MNNGAAPMLSTAATFEIRKTSKGYYLRDRDTFNNWGNVRKDRPFATEAEAIEHAHRCEDFKTGRRSILD